MESHKRFYGPAWIRLVLVTNIIVSEFCRSAKRLAWLAASSMKADRQTDRQTGRQADGWMDGQTDGRTDKQTDN